MFLQSLTISTPDKIIREIKFHKGLNLIVDQTIDSNTDTGNNVGKTTVLRLIDICLGQNPDCIYQNPENKKDVYQLVKDFLFEKKVIVSLVLVDNLDSPTNTIEISRNFLIRKDSLCEINDEKILKTDFEDALMHNIFPDVSIDKPTFRQIISHNIRYDEQRLNNTLKTLNRYTKDEEYETLYLYLFGCNFEEGSRRQELLELIKTEERFKNRLEKKGTKSAYKAALDVIDADIEKYNAKKASLNINSDLDKDITQLSNIKSNINRIGSDITALTIRKNIIIEAKKDFDSQKFVIDVAQLHLIYQQASALIPNLQKTFDEMVKYHNQMLDNKIQFLLEDLPEIDKQINANNNELEILRNEEKTLVSRITACDTFVDLEHIINKLNEFHQKKGEYESIVEQITEVENNIESKKAELQEIDALLFSDNLKNMIDIQLSKFNKIFSDISEQLYNEKYAIMVEFETNKRGWNLYKFSTINANLSSGKKQGEIFCFDIAYTKFADEENIPCLHFLLNDKKELVHNNQLLKIAEIVNTENIQFVASILEDKLPDALKNEEYYVLKLSQNDKLFKIESQFNSD